jgi:hypothetical protein
MGGGAAGAGPAAARPHAVEREAGRRQLANAAAAGRAQQVQWHGRLSQPAGLSPGLRLPTLAGHRARGLHARHPARAAAGS